MQALGPWLPRLYSIVTIYADVCFGCIFSMVAPPNRSLMLFSAFFYSYTLQNLDVRRRKQMMEVPLAQGPPVSMKRASLPLTTEAYSPHPLSSYSTSSSRGMDSHHTEHYDTVYSEDGTSRNHHLDSHIVHRLPAGSDTKYRVLSGSSTPVQYPNYLPQYRSVISANDPRTVMTTAPPFYPQYHVSSGGQPQAVNFSHPGVPIYHNLSTISVSLLIDTTTHILT